MQHISVIINITLHMSYKQKEKTNKKILYLQFLKVFYKILIRLGKYKR